MTTSDSRSRAVSPAHREFVSEAEEILEAMRGGLDALEQDAAAGRVPNPELVNALFRRAHSLKALAGMLELEPIRALAHRLEELLDALRLGRTAFDAPVFGVIEEAVRFFAGLLEAVGDGEALASLADSAGPLSEQIGASVQASGTFGDALDGLDLDPALLRALTEYEEHRLREGVRLRKHILSIDAQFTLEGCEAELATLSEAVAECGELLATLPVPAAAAEAGIGFALLCAAEAPAEEVATRLAHQGTSVRAVHVPHERRAAVRSGEVESLRSIGSSVRVDVRKLEALMNLVGELVIQRSALGDLAERLIAEPALAAAGRELTQIHEGLDRGLAELQGAVLDVRMVPLRRIFDRIARTVRGLCRSLGKEVELEVAGEQTELDKVIVEELVDPLMHIARNAIDHAIETPEERVALGKPARGRIRIEAAPRGNHVVISVSDDGRGIDTEALRVRAEAAGLVTSGEVLDPRESLDLIFAPGLSTRDAVTDTSGRGVGMDVVRANISALGGAVEASSDPGIGATLVMTLPITLAIVRSLIVRVGAQRFAIPSSAVLETLIVEPARIRWSDGRELLHLRGEMLFLQRLSREFGLRDADAPARAADGSQHAVVVGLGELRVGLLVDRIEGQQDTVIKPMRGPIPAVPGIAGATELGDRQPALVLDVAALVDGTLRRREAA